MIHLVKLLKQMQNNILFSMGAEYSDESASTTTYLLKSYLVSSLDEKFLKTRMERLKRIFKFLLVGMML